MSTLRKVPTLSLGTYIQGSSADKVKFVDGLFTGIKDYGFIILKDHGIDSKLFDQGYKVMEQFFKLQTDVKMKYAMADKGFQRGYTPFGKEHAKDSPVMDLKEFWHVGRGQFETAAMKSRYPENLWPIEVPEFQPTFMALFEKLEGAGKIMLEAMSMPLEVKPGYFTEMVRDSNSILRLLHYPPIPSGTDPRCLRSAPHEDINFITLLPAATAAGLQLKDRDGQWLDVVAEPGTLIVDAGDMLSRLTNDVIPSTTHQVVNTPESTNSPRYSMPFFMHPNSDAMLSCLPSCRGSGAKYPDITSEAFLFQRLREIGLMK